MNALSLKGFLLITALAGLVSASAALLYCAITNQFGPAALAISGAGGAALGLLFAGCIYLVQLAVDIRRLHLSAEDLLAGESVVLQTPGSVVHYRTGQPRRPLDAVGGKLFLTNRRLVFLAHRGQMHHYRLDLPLEEVAGVVPCETVMGMPGGVRVITIGGKEELFTFGAVRQDETWRWSKAILGAKDAATTPADEGQP